MTLSIFTVLRPLSARQKATERLPFQAARRIQDFCPLSRARSSAPRARENILQQSRKSFL